MRWSSLLLMVVALAVALVPITLTGCASASEEPVDRDQGEVITMDEEALFPEERAVGESGEQETAPGEPDESAAAEKDVREEDGAEKATRVESPEQEEAVEPGGDRQDFTGQQDTFCQDEEGVAILWDSLRGIFRPLPQIPSPGPNWSLYFHPAWPPLSFLYPPDWQPETITGEQAVGVELVRNDGAALYQNLTIWDYTGRSLDTWLADNVDYVLDLLGEDGLARVRCSREAQQAPAPGVMVHARAVVVTAGHTTLLMTVGATGSQGLPGAQIAITTMASPTSQFTRQTYGVFLPIVYQMLYGKEGMPDRDGDGKPDAQDSYPLDPDRQ